MAGLPPAPSPGGRPAPPPFPALAIRGETPPPLPSIGAWSADRPVLEHPGPLSDVALERGLSGLQTWSARISVSPSQWSVATLLHADAPLRTATTPGGGWAFLDEARLRVTAAGMPADSLPDAPPRTPLLSRLRMLHGRLLPPFASRPVTASWQHLGGQDAVLDLFTQPAGGRVTGFSLAAEAGAGGVVVVGSAPPDREETLARVALPLASVASGDGGTLRWAVLPGWTTAEEAQITTPSVLATARLAPLPQGARDVDAWTDHVPAQGPFRRDLREHADRRVRIRGLAQARIRRFDWQPMMSGRLLTTVVTGVAAGDGFTLVVDVPLSREDVLGDVEALLDLVEVRRPEVPQQVGGTPGLSVAWPAPQPVAAPPPAPPPPPAEGGEGPLPPPTGPTPIPLAWRLLPSVDALVVAAADVRAGTPDEGAPDPRSPDVAAVERSLHRMLRPGPSGSGTTPEVEAVVRERLTGWFRGAADAGVGPAPAAPGDLPGLLWATAALLAEAAARSRDSAADESGLASVLDRAGAALGDPPVMPNPLAVAVPVRRPLRYRLTTGYDGGSGHLLWAADAAARDRWDHPVDHFDLPVPLALARRVQALVDRYDLDHPHVGTEHRPMTPAERLDFHREHTAVLAELGQVLGSAYAIEDRVLAPSPAPLPAALPATVDAVLVAAADVLAGTSEVSALSRPGTADPAVAAVDTALAAVLDPGPHLPWAGRVDVAEQVRSRLSEWSDRARVRALATVPGAITDPGDLLWATAALVVLVARRSGGLARVIDELAADLVPPLAAWDEDLVAVRVQQPVRCRLHIGSGPGSPVVSWADDEAAQWRWQHAVGHWDLPIPARLAGRLQELADHHGTHAVPGRDTGAAGNGAGEPADRAHLVAELRRVLGSAYEVVEDETRPAADASPVRLAAPAGAGRAPTAAQWTVSRLAVPVPDGWFVKEQLTLLAPDGQANVIVSCEPLDPSTTTERYAAVQGELLRREFPQFEEIALVELPLAGGTALLRRFSWSPPDGVRVTQQQVYLATPGTGFTATATTPTTTSARYAPVFDMVLSSLRLGARPSASALGNHWPPSLLPLGSERTYAPGGHGEISWQASPDDPGRVARWAESQLRAGMGPGAQFETHGPRSWTVRTPTPHHLHVRSVQVDEVDTAQLPPDAAQRTPDGTRCVLQWTIGTFASSDGEPPPPRAPGRRRWRPAG